jgi:glycosyltransferase involved in cell wall biosynthesis
LYEKEISEETKNDVRQKLTIIPDQKIIITTSRLVVKNAVEDIIDALTRLPRTIRLLVLGVGPLEKKLKEKVKAGMLEDRVTFLGHIENNKLPEFLAISDVFVRPSISEGQGISFIEAMAAGVPIIATPVGGIPDFLIDKKTGLFCNVHDSESIAIGINQLLNNQDLKNSLIFQAKSLVKEKYNWDILASQMQQEIFDFI